MKKRYLIISADSKNVVGAKNIRDQLLKNHYVLMINLFEHITADTFKLKQNRAIHLKSIIRNFNPEFVYICAHGLPGQVNMCFYQKFTTIHDDELQNMFTAEEFGALLNQILPKKYLNFDLVMCFGSRTSHYKINHITHIRAVNIFDSFAYRLIIILAKSNSHFTLNSYVTAIGYENNSYNIEHEGAFELGIERDNIADQRLKVQYKLLNLELSGEERDRLEEIDYRLLMNQIKINEKLSYMHSNNTYGKVVYIIDNNQCVINFKHGLKDINLYQGILKTKVPYYNLLLIYAQMHYVASTFILLTLSVLTAYVLNKLKNSFLDDNNHSIGLYK